MACVNITGNLTRTGSVVGNCTFSVEIRRDSVLLATVPVATVGNGITPYSYQDNNAGASHVYTATTLPSACGCGVGTSSVNWGTVSGCTTPSVVTKLTATSTAINVPYSGTIVLANATSATVAGLPAGLTASALVGNTITVSGTPTVSGTFAPTVSATNACGTSTPSSITNAVAGPLTVTPGAQTCVAPISADLGFSPIENQCGLQRDFTLPLGNPFPSGQLQWSNTASVSVSVSHPSVMTIVGAGTLSPSISGTPTVIGVYTATFTGVSNQTCPNCTVLVRYTVTNGAPVCNTNWSLSTAVFTVGTPTNQTYTATGIPAGCSLTLGAFVGNVPWPSAGAGQATVVLTDVAPSVTYSQTWTPEYVGQDFNFRPINSAACMTCNVAPTRIDFDVQ